MSNYTLVFNPPTRATPGYLRRQRKMLHLEKRQRILQREMERINAARRNGGLTAEQNEIEIGLYDEIDAILDESIAMILPFVVQPADREAAREALLDASEEQIAELRGQSAGGATSPLAPTNGTSASAASESG